MLHKKPENHSVHPRISPTPTNFAQICAAKKWAVLPLHHPLPNGACSCNSQNCHSHSKHPLTKSGCKDASTNFETIRNWWSKWPHANIGIATESISKLYVLDIDEKSGGFTSLKKLEQEFGTLPTSHVVRTGGGGLHYYFKTPETTLRNRTTILLGIDFRGKTQRYRHLSSKFQSAPIFDWNL